MCAPVQGEKLGESPEPARCEKKSGKECQVADELPVMRVAYCARNMTSLLPAGHKQDAKYTAAAAAHDMTDGR